MSENDIPEEIKSLSVGAVNPTEITTEMQRSYLDYAMSVIVSRALPDVRDGLKPVHRRILYSMHELGLHHPATYKKSARIVGEVMGKYHPHGDMPVYDALVRMAQDFNMRYPLVDGQGNFGSVDGDSPAAMRYTEARLAKIAAEILQDIDKETIDWTDNFDGSLKQPVVMPAKLPNLLLMGSAGIAVGMATNIPPHNLSEIVDAATLLIKNPAATTEELMEVVKGPDFPTGAAIYDVKEIANAYATGKGRIVMRAVAEIEEVKGGRFDILVSELPYQVNKATLVARIAELVRERKIDGVADLRDESDRRGMRIVLELKRDSQPKQVLNSLYKHTAMQLAYNYNAVALVGGTPQTLTLKSMLESYIAHRQDVVTKRAEFELRAAKARGHILEGLKIALDHLDSVIKTIRESKSADDAKGNLITRFKLTEIQATAILDMQLRRLAALERQKIEDEYKEILKTISYLESLLSDAKKILAVIAEELAELKEKYGDPRRTKIYKSGLGEFSEADLIAVEPVIITVTKGGYIKRSNIDAFRTQGRGGKGVTGMDLKEEDAIAQILQASTLDNILFFTNRGRVFQLKVHELPESSRTAKGQAVVNLISIEQDEIVTSTLTYSPSKVTSEPGANYGLLMATRRGLVKKTPLSSFANIRRSGIIAINLQAGDELGWVRLSGQGSQVILVTGRGQSIKFKGEGVRPTGRDTSGVVGIKLGKDDLVVGMDVVTDKDSLLAVLERGFGKRTPLSSWPTQGRGGSGVKAAEVTERTGRVMTARVVVDDREDLIITSAHGQVIKLPVADVPSLGRQTQGVILMRFANKEDFVTTAATLLPGEKVVEELQTVKIEAKVEAKTAAKSPTQVKAKKK